MNIHDLLVSVAEKIEARAAADTDPVKWTDAAVAWEICGDMDKASECYAQATNAQIYWDDEKG